MVTVVAGEEVALVGDVAMFIATENQGLKSGGRFGTSHTTHRAPTKNEARVKWFDAHVQSDPTRAHHVSIATLQAHAQLTWVELYSPTHIEPKRS